MDRFRLLERAAVPMMSLTPHAAAGAGLAALALRRKGPSVTAAAAAAAMAAVVVPRAIRHRQPDASGPELAVLTVNMLQGGAAGPALVGLVRATGADVLFLQELTDDAKIKLKRAGLNELLPNEMLEIEGYRYRGSGIYARFPLRDGLTIGPSYASQPTARLDLPSGHSVQLVCVHPHPPWPSWSLAAAPRWRGELDALPPAAAPGDPPVVLVGDYNATVDHAQFRRLLGLGYVDAASQVGNGLMPTWGPEPRGRPPCSPSTTSWSTRAAPCSPRRCTPCRARTTAPCSPGSGCRPERAMPGCPPGQAGNAARVASRPIAE